MAVWQPWMQSVTLAKKDFISQCQHPGMIHISLRNLIFHAFHGLYEEEKQLGNQFEVNLDIYFPEPDTAITHLDQTVNYVTLYNLVQERMQVPEPLLETLAMDIASSAKREFPQIFEINVSISKINMPLVNFRGNISVTYHKKYSIEP